MPHFRIKMVNQEFVSESEGEYHSLDAASKSAVATGARVASEAILDGTPTAAVELQIYDGKALLAHHVVSISVADLLAGVP